jgi:hypothetical protein
MINFIRHVDRFIEKAQSKDHTFETPTDKNLLL